MALSPLDRRGFLISALGLGLVMGMRPAVAGERIVVMTSYPQEMISRYVDAFAKSAEAGTVPGTRVDVVWRSGDDAKDYLLGAGKGQVDVYWSPALRTFVELARDGAFRKLSIDRTGLPGRIGTQSISDPDGFYEATEVAGYGLVINPAYLKKAGLPEPSQWEDLAKPDYAGHITMPVPGKIGFAPVITEVLLQAYGWKQGWALLAAIAANATLQAGRGDEAIAPIVQGEKGVGVTIDFFAAQAIARGAPLHFVYPAANAFEPATIAIPREASNLAGAMSFVRFVLSEEGQSLLIDADLRRLAVRPSVYAHAPADYFNPWTREDADRLSLDNALFAQRRNLDNALFDHLIFEPREKAATVWTSVRQLEDSAGLSEDAKALVAEARARLTASPLGEDEALRLSSAFVGRRRSGGEVSPDSAAAETAWKQAVAANIEAAAQAAGRAEALARR
jgi:phosphoglycerate transport regulatory protein PgtC